jgi:hypothetical protein
VPAWMQFVAALTTVLGAFLGGGFWMRGKIRAEAAKLRAEADHQRAASARVITDTTVVLLEPLQREVIRLAARAEAADTMIDEYRQRVGGLERRERELPAAIAPHSEWDLFMLALLAQHNIAHPPMPPILPAAAHRRSDERTRVSDRDDD